MKRARLGNGVNKTTARDYGHYLDITEPTSVKMGTDVQAAVSTARQNVNHVIFLELRRARAV